jgi:hypothetical protein
MFIKKILIAIGFLCWISLIKAQTKPSDFTIDANYFGGNIMLHDNTLLHLTVGRPQGAVLSWNKLTNGDKFWQSRYNYPDYGLSFVHQDFGNPILGYNVSLNGHFNFYFLKRRLMLRLGSGIGYMSNPFDKETNPKNIAISTRLTSSTLVMLNYKAENILFNKIGFQAGLMFTHHSIGNIKSPNMGINTLAINMGLIYDFSKKEREFKPLADETAFSKKIQYNIVLRSGANQSDRVGTKRYPFLVFSGYAERKIAHTNSLQAGTDIFLSYFLKEYLRYESILDRGQTDPNADFKRVGIFVGHELFINKFSFLTQVGYYLYYPNDFGERYYIRAGFKYYISKNIFGVASIKSHGADAEAFEFGIGYKI